MVKGMCLTLSISRITTAIRKECVSAFFVVGYPDLLVQGDGLPSDKDQAATRSDNGGKVNTSQFVPRACKELEEHADEYQLLHEALTPLFCWIQSLVSLV
jgi:hypothetical protein